MTQNNTTPTAAAIAAGAHALAAHDRRQAGDFAPFELSDLTDEASAGYSEKALAAFTAMLPAYSGAAPDPVTLPEIGDAPFTDRQGLNDLTIGLGQIRWVLQSMKDGGDHKDDLDPFIRIIQHLRRDLPARLEGQIALLSETAALLRTYEAHHLSKITEPGREQKAWRNGELAARIESALNETSSLTTAVAPLKDDAISTLVDLLQRSRPLVNMGRIDADPLTQEQAGPLLDEIDDALNRFEPPVELAPFSDASDEAVAAAHAERDAWNAIDARWAAEDKDA